MAVPLRSENPGQPNSMQFAHFGVLDTGAQSKASTMTSLCVNAAVAFVLIVISAAAAKHAVQQRHLLTELVVPVADKKPEPVKPKIIPPKPKLPDIVKVEPPKITVPQIKLPEIPKQPEIKMAEKPVMIPVAPQKVVAKAAPVAVSLAHPEAASVPNHDAHPTAVRIGATDSPINNLKGPSVAPVNMGRGMPGMNSANTGNGPQATKVVMGNGSAGSTTIRGNGAIAVAGIPHGVPGGTGTGRTAGQVSLGQVEQPAMPRAAAIQSPAQHREPTLIFKPKPEYTAEARQLHIEGTVTLRIRVMPNGSVEVIGVTRGLGHGLDESARQAAQATRFKPATDAAGNPITWEGIVNVAFELAG